MYLDEMYVEICGKRDFGSTFSASVVVIKFSKFTNASIQHKFISNIIYLRLESIIIAIYSC